MSPQGIPGSSAEFIQELENMVQHEGLTLLEAIHEFIERNEDTGIEIDTIASIINKNPALKDKLQEEAEGLNLIESEGRLPL